ncbi:MAG TPA: Lrp/AsnC family transcriptional regulator [Candidatus Nanopusillus sp.]|nr:Lrp/AsnC family transcriptional regulator [Candidatus Nanopusillus sp.]
MVRSSYIDVIDLKILQILSENARTPYTRIARILGLSEAAIRKRVKRLERKGVIEGYTIKINYKLLGYNVAWIGIDTVPERMISVLEKVSRIDKNILQSIYTSVGDHDIMLEIVYKDYKEINELVKNLERIDGVIRVCPAILIEKIK